MPRGSNDRYFAMSCAEIAHELGTTPKDIERIEARALYKLRNHADPSLVILLTIVDYRRSLQEQRETVEVLR